ncbi:MAG: MFS transporter [Sphingomonas fennica]
MSPQARVFALTSLVVLLDGFDVQAMALAVPALSAAWGIAPAGFSLALGLSVLGLGLGAAFLAPLGDRFGRRPLLIGCTALLGLSSLATALAGSVIALAALRLVTGLALGACQGNATALMSDHAPPARRAWLLTLMGCNVSVGSLAAGFVAPWLVAWGGWQGIFVAGGLLPLVLSAVLAVALPEAPGHGAPAAADGPRGGLGGLLSPALRPKTLLLWAIYSLNTLLLYLVLSWLPTLLGAAGWPPAAALRSVMAFHVGGIAGALTLALVVDRGRATGALVAGFVVAAIGAALFALLPPLIPAWSAALALMGAGVAGTTFVVFALAAAAYPSAIRAAGYGWLAAVARIGAVIGPLAGGGLLALSVAPRLIMAGLAIPALLCALLALAVRRTIDLPARNA